MKKIIDAGVDGATIAVFFRAEVDLISRCFQSGVSTSSKILFAVVSFFCAFIWNWCLRRLLSNIFSGDNDDFSDEYDDE